LNLIRGGGGLLGDDRECQLQIKLIVMFTGVLLPELLTCLIIIEKKTPELLQQLNIISTLHSLLDGLDAFNRCAPGLLRDDADDLSFPSLQGLSLLLSLDDCAAHSVIGSWHRTVICLSICKAIYLSIF